MVDFVYVFEEFYNYFYGNNEPPPHIIFNTSYFKHSHFKWRLKFIYVEITEWLQIIDFIELHVGSPITQVKKKHTQIRGNFMLMT